MIEANDLSVLFTAPGPAAGAAGRRLGAEVSLEQLRQEVAEWQRAFSQHAGERFALLFEDTLEFAAALFGVWHAGKTAVLAGDATAGTLQALGSWVQGWATDVLSAAQCPGPRVQRASGGAVMALQSLTPQREQLVIYTSGSTGAPQPIVKRLSQLFDEVQSLERCFGAQAAQTQVLATVSHQHIYGLLFRVLWPLAAGRPIHAQRLPFIEDLLPALPDGARALLVASPAHLKRLPMALADGPLKERVACVFSSGGPLPTDALPDCLRVFGRAPIEVYGSSETGGVAWRQRQTAQPGWKPLPGVQWRLVGQQLQIISPHAGAVDWFDTADNARAVGDGFELLGRVDCIVKVEEKRVSLKALEAALLSTPWVHELAVTTLADPREQLAVVIVPSPEAWMIHDAQGKAALVERLRQAMLPMFEPVVLPRRWRFVARLPVNAQGKVTQDRLRLLFDPRRPAVRVRAWAPGHATLAIVAAANMPQFEGHFQGHPILPGVAQVEWAILLARELFDLPETFVGLEALKFQQVITPHLPLEMELQHSPAQARLQFRVSSARGQHASGRVLFAGAAA